MDGPVDGVDFNRHRVLLRRGVRLDAEVLPTRHHRCTGRRQGGHALKCGTPSLQSPGQVIFFQFPRDFAGAGRHLEGECKGD